MLISPLLWQELMQLRGDQGRDQPMFRSRKFGGALHADQIRTIVAAAGERAGIKGVSPHWFRHSHASHALQRGASIALVPQMQVRVLNSVLDSKFAVELTVE